MSAALRQGDQLFRTGKFQQASAFFLSAAAGPLSLQLKSLPARALGNRGACQFALHQYQTALQTFLEARRRAENAGDDAAAAVLHANIASVYVQMGEYSAAAEWVERSIAALSGPDRRLHLAKLQLQLATLRARQGRMAESLELFRQGISGADRVGDTELYALGWNRLGEEFLQRGDLNQAEHALLEAYRLRKLNRLALDSSYRNLGRLRLAQGDLRSAETLLDRAVECAGRPDGLVPSWQVYHSRGRVRLAQGRLREALDDFRAALRLARAWRLSTPADDTNRIGTENTLEQLYSGIVDAGNRLYLESHDPALLRETFAAAEENRAASLRALLRRPNSGEPQMPPAYWEAVARLQAAEVAELRHADAGGVEAARAELVRMEASVGPELRPPPPDLAEQVRRALDSQTVLLSFHLGPSVSWVWALDQSGLALYTLPPERTIEREVQASVAAIREDLPARDATTSELYRTLFANLARHLRDAPRWLLALDQGLFDAPFAALADSSRRRAFVAERHVIQVVPGAAYWLDSIQRAETPVAPLFVGVGDAIYNCADSRAPASREKATGQLALPRLVGSSAEIEASARAWNGPSVLLRGSDASSASVQYQLRHQPAVLHLATHYLESAAQPRYGLIALSLARTGDPELLTPFEIARWRIRAGLVVLSGCHSAAGVPLPATGLQGLTRAWLAAGAQSVISTLWETPDDDGALFQSFYRNLRSGPRLDAPRALHNAQLDMIRSGARTASPRYWGAYSIVGNPGKTVLETWN